MIFNLSTKLQQQIMNKLLNSFSTSSIKRSIALFQNHIKTNNITTVYLKPCDVELIEFGKEDDHVHILVNVPPKLAIANFVGKLKGKSSYFLRREHWAHLKKKLWGKHLWSPSYCCVSSGGASLDIVKQYITNQRKAPTERQLRHTKKTVPNANRASSMRA